MKYLIIVCLLASTGLSASRPFDNDGNYQACCGDSVEVMLPSTDVLPGGIVEQTFYFRAQEQDIILCLKNALKNQSHLTRYIHRTYLHLAIEKFKRQASSERMQGMVGICLIAKAGNKQFVLEPYLNFQYASKVREKN